MTFYPSIVKDKCGYYVFDDRRKSVIEEKDLISRKTVIEMLKSKAVCYECRDGYEQARTTTLNIIAMIEAIPGGGE